MKPFIPARLEFVVFGVLVSGMMSFLVSGVAMVRAVGMKPDFHMIWFQAWLPSWGIAFVAILFVVPLVRRLLARLVMRD